MGWFLRSGKAKSKAKGAGAKRGKRGSGAESRGPRRGWIAAAWIVAAAALCVGAWRGRVFLIDHLGEVQARSPRVVLTSTPAWFGDRRAERLCREAASALTDDPFDADALEAARESLLRSGWVGAVDRLVRRPDGRVEADVVFREPVALVGSAAGYHLVATERVDGSLSVVRLPGTYAYHEVSEMELIPVTGAATPPPPRPGEVWPGRDVAAGVALAIRLSRERFAGQVRQIDVANHAGRRDRRRAHLMIKTRSGAVLWGRAPGREDPLEPDAEAKIAALRQLHERFGAIDAGGETVDLQLTDRIVFESDGVGG